MKVSGLVELVGEGGGVDSLDVGVFENVVESFDGKALACCSFLKSLACFRLCFTDFSISKIIW